MAIGPLVLQSNYAFRSIDQNHRVISLGFNRFIIRILGKLVEQVSFLSDNTI